MLRNHHRRLAFESLEGRRLLAFAAGNGLVGIKGTNRDDVIKVERVTPQSYGGSYVGDLLLTMNGEQAVYSYSQNAVIILGLGGNDQITVADDVHLPVYIDAGSGDDTISTSFGDDLVLGGAGNDTIFTKLGNDKIDGGAGDDVINCGDGNDTAVGGKGNDTIHGDNGVDVLAGDAGIDVLYGDAGDDACNGGAANDSVFGGDGNDLVGGGAGIDVCHGDNGNDALFGEAGNDMLFGDDGYDELHGGKGLDEIHGGLGKDFLYGDEGNDLLLGEDGNDNLVGGVGLDQCFGGEDDDQLIGGREKDVLDGGAGNNLSDSNHGAAVVSNCLEADLDAECRAELTGGNGNAWAELDVQNIDGTVQYTLRVVMDSPFPLQGTCDVAIADTVVGQMTLVNGYGEFQLSTDPAISPLGFSPDFPGVAAGIQVDIRSWAVGTLKTAYVV
jgi:Ca2+-binding RTX toxin-like protein